MRMRGSCKAHEENPYHEPLVRMMEKVLFSLFSNVFHPFQPCERMRKHEFAGRNTQQKTHSCLA